MKLATIGSGAIVDLMYKSIEGIDGIEPVAVYSRTMDKAQAFAQKHNVKKAFDDLDTMLADDEIDTVYIASPNSLHFSQAKKALEAKKNVILEKPFTATKEEAQELFELAEKNGVMIFEAITNIHTPNYGLLRDNLDKVGKVRDVVLNYSQYSSRYPQYMAGQIANVFNPAMNGGALVDINIYNIHLATALFGKPTAIQYFPVMGWNGVDTSGVLVLEYPDKVITCIGAKDSSSEPLGLIQGDLGTMQITGGSTGRVTDVDFLPPRKEDQVIEPERISIDQGLHMTYEFIDFLTALNENNQELYDKCKQQTLLVADIMDEAKAQRDAKFAAKKENA